MDTEEESDNESDTEDISDAEEHDIYEIINDIHLTF